MKIKAEREKLEMKIENRKLKTQREMNNERQKIVWDTAPHSCNDNKKIFHYLCFIYLRFCSCVLYSCYDVLPCCYVTIGIVITPCCLIGLYSYQRTVLLYIIYMYVYSF